MNKVASFGHHRTIMSVSVTTTLVLNPVQKKTFDELLSIGTTRPVAPMDLAIELHTTIEEGTREALKAWNDQRLFFTKSTLSTALACEGKVLADRMAQAEVAVAPSLRLSTVVGMVAHRAIQLASTHPGMIIHEYVSEALNSCKDNETGVEDWYAQAGLGERSDLVNQATSRVTNFLDSWPELNPAWNARFEENMQAKIGHLTLSARMDLIFGRPRSDGTQTMLLCDFKSGGLHEGHDEEADFYALVATLRHGVPPYRSCVYSLASGDWTEPDVTVEKLRSMAVKVVEAVNRTVAVLTEARTPELTPGKMCSWCPVSKTCPAVQGQGDVVILGPTKA